MLVHDVHIDRGRLAISPTASFWRFLVPWQLVSSGSHGFAYPLSNGGRGWTFLHVISALQDTHHPAWNQRDHIWRPWWCKQVMHKQMMWALSRGQFVWQMSVLTVSDIDVGISNCVSCQSLADIWQGKDLLTEAWSYWENDYQDIVGQSSKVLTERYWHPWYRWYLGEDDSLMFLMRISLISAEQWEGNALDHINKLGRWGLLELQTSRGCNLSPGWVGWFQVTRYR